MSRMNRTFTSITLTIAILVLSACSPQINYPGQQICDPHIDKGSFIAMDGLTLPIRKWIPQDIPLKAIVIALHGFNDYSNFFTSAGNYLISHGIASYAYDQRGFGGAPGRGLWAGVEAYTNDLAGFVKAIRSIHPGVPLYVLGESMGGAVTIVTMTGMNPPDVDGIILVAPAVWGRDTMPWYQRWLLNVSAHTLPWMQLTGKGMKLIPSDNREMLRSLGRDAQVIKATRIDTVYGLSDLMDAALLQAEKLQVPTLVQYGENDQIIPKKPIFIMLGKMPDSARKAFYVSGYHMLLRDLQGDKPLADIAAWIADHHVTLPYGTDSW